jgi:hypothetical protein
MFSNGSRISLRLHRAAIADPTLHTTFERHYAERLLESRQVIKGFRLVRIRSARFPGAIMPNRSASGIALWMNSPRIRVAAGNDTTNICWTNKSLRSVKRRRRKLQQKMNNIDEWRKTMATQETWEDCPTAGWPHRCKGKEGYPYQGTPHAPVASRDGWALRQAPQWPPLGRSNLRSSAVLSPRSASVQRQCLFAFWRPSRHE